MELRVSTLLELSQRESAGRPCRIWVGRSLDALSNDPGGAASWSWGTGAALTAGGRRMNRRVRPPASVHSEYDGATQAAVDDVEPVATQQSSLEEARRSLFRCTPSFDDIELDRAAGLGFDDESSFFVVPVAPRQPPAESYSKRCGSSVGWMVRNFSPFCTSPVSPNNTG